MEVPQVREATQTIARRPVLTRVIIVVCLLLFLGINIDGHTGDAATLARWGVPQAADIFGGRLWGLVTPAFLHVQVGHILINLYWFGYFGGFLERHEERTYYLLFILGACAAGTLSQLASSDATGMGLSGVVYAMFAFLWFRKKETAYRRSLDHTTIGLFFISLALGFWLNWTHTAAIGNATHVAGLCWGLLLAASCRLRRQDQWAVAGMALGLLVALVMVSPLTVSRQYAQAIRFHRAGKIAAARKAYRAILQAAPGDAFATANLQQLDQYEMELKAYRLHEAEQRASLMRDYRPRLSFDSAAPAANVEAQAGAAK